MTADEALAQAAAIIGADSSQLQILASEQVPSRLPWQPKKTRFTVAKRPPALDGHWEVDYSLGSVWLTVYPPDGSGKPVMPEEVLKAWRSWPLTSFDHDRIFPIIEKAAGKPQPIGSYEAPKNTPFSALISHNEMAAYLVLGVEPTGAADPLADALATLQQAGVVHGIDVEPVRIALTRWQLARAILVAQGTPPDIGEDAAILTTPSPASPTILPDGSPDFSACHFDEAIEAGDPLLILQPAKRGSEGMTVKGASIPTTFGKDLDLTRYVGTNVAISADGLQLAATISGSLVRTSDGKISVLPLLKIPKSADHAPTNVDFAGNVVVEGELTDGSSIRATGDLPVKGPAIAARLDADGVIMLLRGMVGRGTGEIHSKTRIEVGLLEDATVTCDGSILISGEASGSHVTAGDSVTVTGQAGRGGSIQAGHEITAKTVGSARGVLTKLTIEPRTDGGDPVSHPPSEDRGARRSGSRPSMRILDRIFAPAIITIGTAQLTIDQEIPYVRFVESNGAILTSPAS
ncbi:MAG: DUF342 domain-containing protein [Chloroflexi bacterium]|nr:DUF342 domain-containing protein [Chloroflexota bacterium]